jgi:hypothetical protein
MTVTLAKLNSLKDINFEAWPKHGVKLRAVSANADGSVNSGILADGRYFHRVWSDNFKRSEFKLEGK